VRKGDSQTAEKVALQVRVIKAASDSVEMIAIKPHTIQPVFMPESTVDWVVGGKTTVPSEHPVVVLVSVHAVRYFVCGLTWRP